MNRIKHLLIVSSVVMAGPGISRAQHFDVLVEQMDGRLVTGTADFDSNQWSLGRRVFFRDFDGDFAINNPGFNALGSTAPNLPPGSEALPGNAALSWDFLPMTIARRQQKPVLLERPGNGRIAGTDAGRRRVRPAAGTELSVVAIRQVECEAFGRTETNAVVPGGVIDDTAADGSLHRHRFWFLEDGDGSGATLAGRRHLPVGDAAADDRAGEFAADVHGVRHAGLVGRGARRRGRAVGRGAQLNLRRAITTATASSTRPTTRSGGIRSTMAGAGLAADGAATRLVDAADYELWKTALRRDRGAPFRGSRRRRVSERHWGDGAPEPATMLIGVLPAVCALGHGAPRR